MGTRRKWIGTIFRSSWNILDVNCSMVDVRRFWKDLFEENTDNSKWFTKASRSLRRTRSLIGPPRCRLSASKQILDTSRRGVVHVFCRRSREKMGRLSRLWPGIDRWDNRVERVLVDSDARESPLIAFSICVRMSCSLIGLLWLDTLMNITDGLSLGAWLGGIALDTNYISVWCILAASAVYLENGQLTWYGLPDLQGQSPGPCLLTPWKIDLL